VSLASILETSITWNVVINIIGPVGIYIRAEFGGTTLPVRSATGGLPRLFLGGICLVVNAVQSGCEGKPVYFGEHIGHEPMSAAFSLSSLRVASPLKGILCRGFRLDARLKLGRKKKERKKEEWEGKRKKNIFLYPLPCLVYRQFSVPTSPLDLPKYSVDSRTSRRGTLLCSGYKFRRS
jgi:hypothetical protein